MIQGILLDAQEDIQDQVHYQQTDGIALFQLVQNSKNLNWLL